MGYCHSHVATSLRGLADDGDNNLLAAPEDSTGSSVASWAVSASRALRARRGVAGRDGAETAMSPDCFECCNFRLSTITSHLPRMKVTYLTEARLPTEKANGVNVANMAQALANLGHEVELVRLRRRQPRSLACETIGTYYGFEPRFIERVLPNIDGVLLTRARPQRLREALTLTYETAAGVRLAWWARRHPADLIWVRHVPTAYFLSFGCAPFVLEIHRLPRGPQLGMLRRVARHQAATMVPVSQALREDLEAVGVSPRRCVVGRNAAAATRHALRQGRDRVADRRAAGLPSTGVLVLYTGQFFAGKGVEVLTQAAALLTTRATVVLMGGSGTDRARISALAAKTGAANVIVRAPVAARDIWWIQEAADVLVLPLSGNSDTTARHTMPIKLFEYLAAGKAIVASDLPVTREVLHDGVDAVLVPPDDPVSLAAAIDRIVLNEVERRSLGANARVLARRLTWESRAAAILAETGVVTSSNTGSLSNRMVTHGGP